MPPKRGRPRLVARPTTEAKPPTKKHPSGSTHQRAPPEPQLQLDPDPGENSGAYSTARRAAAAAAGAAPALSGGDGGGGGGDDRDVGISGFFCSNPWCTSEMAQKRCSMCKVVRYCDRNCQVAHWPQHKATCNAISACQGLCHLFAVDRDYNKTIRDLKTDFESRDNQRHCIGMVCHTADRVRALCNRNNLLGIDGLKAIKVDIKNFTLGELRAATTAEQSWPHGKGQGQVGDKDAQLLKHSWQRVVGYTEQYAMADEIALFVHTNVDEGDDGGGGGEVVTSAKIKIHAGPQLPGGVVIAPSTGFETFET